MDPIQLRTHHYVDADGILVSNADWLDEEYANRLRQEAIGRSETHGEWTTVGTVDEVGPVEPLAGWVDEAQRINWQEIGTGVIVFGGRRTPARMWVGPGVEPQWLARQENPGYGLDDEPVTADVPSIIDLIETARRRMGEMAVAVRTSMNSEFFADLAALMRIVTDANGTEAAADGPCPACGEVHDWQQYVIPIAAERTGNPYTVYAGERMPDGDQPSTGKGDPLADVYGAFDRTMASIDEVLNEPS